jgi:ubiquinone/menaquinone biosynthesis C-methylase UbiE
MDEVTKYNQARWKALTEANALFTRPKLKLDIDSAQKIVDAEERFGNLQGKDVLCLAGGGGQQSAAFAILGANVSVFDISAEQLERDKEVAKHYQKEIKIFQGDMRNLDCFASSSFDIVHHPYSLNFVPNAAEVFYQVARVLRSEGLYRLTCANPFLMGVGQNDWNGEGYILKNPYFSGEEITYNDQDWVYDKNKHEPIPNPIEYRHTLSNLINNLTSSGFKILNVSDNSDISPDKNAEPASWEHFTAFIPPWLSFLAKKEI